MPGNGTGESIGPDALTVNCSVPLPKVSGTLYILQEYAGNTDGQILSFEPCIVR